MDEVAVAPILGIWDKLRINWIEVRHLFEVRLEHHFLNNSNPMPVAMGTVGPVNVTSVLVSEKCNLGVFLSKFFLEVIIQQL